MVVWIYWFLLLLILYRPKKFQIHADGCELSCCHSAFLLCVLDLTVHAAALLHVQCLWALHEDTLSSARDARKLYPQQGAIWPSVSWTDVILLVLQDKGTIQICFGIMIRQSYHSHVMVMCGLWAITLSKKNISKDILQLQRYFLRTSNYFSQGSIDLLCWWR